MWAVVEKFHEYLYGSTFNDYTDNNPITYILTKANVDAASHCWVFSHANYNFWLSYRAGKTNIDADALLRVSWPKCATNIMAMYQQITVQALQKAALEGPVSLIES